MEPVSIDIDTADAEQLRAECRRLGFAVPDYASPPHMRVWLRRYAAQCKEYDHQLQNWLEYMRRLCLTIPDLPTVATTSSAVYDHLYQRLADAGYVGQDKTGKPLHHPDGGVFYILRREANNLVIVVCPTDCSANHEHAETDCDILFAASCAFEDMRDIYLIMESYKAGHGYDEAS